MSGFCDFCWAGAEGLGSKGPDLELELEDLLLKARLETLL